MPGTRAPRGRIRGAATAIVGVLLGVLVGLAQPGAASPAPGGSASARLAAERQSGELETTFDVASRPRNGAQTSSNVGDTEARAPSQSGRGGLAADLTTAPPVARSWRGAARQAADTSGDELGGPAFTDVRAPPGQLVA